MMRKLRWLILGIATLLVTGVFSAVSMAPASASEEPQVNLANISYGAASFQADGSAAAKAAVKTTSGAKIWLNVQVNPMTKKQIKPGSCRRAPVGKWFFNEVVDPVTGKRYFKKMRVQAGDNTFCQDRRGKWRKKSCGNEARGIFGVPRPRPALIKTYGVIRDYLSFSGALTVKGVESGEAVAHVVQYDGDRKVCEARGSVKGSAEAYVSMSVTVRSRSVIGIRTNAVNQARYRASTSTTVKGTLNAKVDLSLEGNAMAWCNYTPPPPEQPAVTGDVICKNPPHMHAPDGNGVMVCELSRSDNVKPTLSQFSVEALNDYAYFSQPTEFGYREEAAVNPCPNNVLCVRVQVWAVSPGLFKYRAKFAQYDQLDGQFLIEEDDF